MRAFVRCDDVVVMMLCRFFAARNSGASSQMCAEFGERSAERSETETFRFGCCLFHERLVGVLPVFVSTFFCIKP